MPVLPKNVSLRQLLAFQEVAHSAAFAPAARRLCITQSALSESIRQLEGALGVRLFDRTTRTVGLTDAGAMFLEDVQLVLEALEQGLRRMDDLTALRGAEVRIAAAPSVLASVVLPSLPGLRRRYPGIRVQLYEEGADAIARVVREGRVDFGIGGWHPSAHDLDTQPLLRDRMGLLASPGEPLLKATEIVASALAQLPFVGLTDDTAISELLRSATSMPDNVLQPQLRVSNTLLLAQAIRLNLGVSIVPALTSRHPLLRDLRFRPLDEPSIERRIMLLRRPRRSLSPAAQVFCGAVVQQARTLTRHPGIELEAIAACAPPSWIASSPN
ncbi:LysR substrate-binding domain-containing protein [Ottowia sp.]|uniref:LysR family transcriptional regulator n=1 Tax=Ottowia sp. TaxID=1898956 RepID=UPI002602F7C9|nr:LysR substrate-binding domain-containing protein [Ottowia sp.]